MTAETFQVDGRTAARIRQLAVELECGLCDVIRHAVLELEAEVAAERDFEERMKLRQTVLSDYTPPREFANEDEYPF